MDTQFSSTEIYLIAQENIFIMRINRKIQIQSNKKIFGTMKHKFSLKLNCFICIEENIISSLQ